MKNELVAGFYVSESKVTVIPFGINNTVANTNLTAAGARRQLGMNQSEKALLFFGNIAPIRASNT